MRVLIASALLLASMPATANAPFCVVPNAGMAQCFYYDVASCQQAARTLGGLCSANPQAQAQAAQVRQPVQQYEFKQYDYVGAYQRSLEAGQRARQQREEHEARMRVLEAQEAAYRAQAQPAQQPPAQAISTAPVASAELYKCRSEQGAIRYAATPIAGLSCEHLGAVSTQPEPAEPAPKRGPAKGSFNKN